MGIEEPACGKNSGDRGVENKCILEKCEAGPGATVLGMDIETYVYTKINAVHRFT